MWQHIRVSFIRFNFCSRKIISSFLLKILGELFTCLICGKSFDHVIVSKMHLGIHGKEWQPGITVEITHTDEMPLESETNQSVIRKRRSPCLICSFKASTTSELIAHWRNSHSVEQCSAFPGRFKCTICNEEFEQTAALIEHIERHRGNFYY